MVLRVILSSVLIVGGESYGKSDGTSQVDRRLLIVVKEERFFNPRKSVIG